MPKSLGLVLRAIFLGAGLSAASAVCAQPLSPLGASHNAPISAAFSNQDLESSSPWFLTQRLAEGSSVPQYPGSDPWAVNDIGPIQPTGAVDALRVWFANPDWSQAGAASPEGRAFEGSAFELTIAREWPDAVGFGTRRYSLAVSSHAGVGWSSVGRVAEAGAGVTLGEKRPSSTASRLNAIGVLDGATFGGEGRWYLFAAARGRAVGLNMIRDQGDWHRGGWSTDQTSALIGDAQAGVGWRKGDMQTSLAYVHREVKGQHMLWGQDTRGDSMVALSLSIKPRR